MRPILFSLTAFLGLACGASSPAEFKVVFNPCSPLVLSPAGEVSAEQLESARSATAMWNQLGLTRLSVGEAGATGIGLRFRDGPEPFHGLYEDELGEVVVNLKVADGDERAVTIAHEVGHAMGLLHVPASERESVMNPGNLTVLPTAQDEAQLSEQWAGCGEG